MKVGELKAKLAKCTDDEMEIYVAPMMEIKLMDTTAKELTPSLFERYKITAITQMGSVRDTGVYDLSVVFGYDDTADYGMKLDEKTETDEFVN